MNPSYNPDQNLSSWMSPSEARRTEFAALTVGMFNCLESLRQCLDEHDAHQHKNTHRLASGLNFNSHITISNPTCSYLHSDYSPQSVLPTNPAEIYRDSTRPLTNQLYASNYPRDAFIPNQAVSTNLPPAPHSSRDTQLDRSKLAVSFPSTRITNQKRANSVNRGGSLRREAPADKICEYCQASFTRNERLRYHIESAHLQLEPEFDCDVPGCNRAFRQKSDLLRHQRTVHRSLFSRETSYFSMTCADHGKKL